MQNSKFNPKSFEFKLNIRINCKFKSTFLILIDNKKD